MPGEESSTSFKEVNADPLINMGPKQGLKNIINYLKARPAQLINPLIRQLTREDCIFQIFEKR
jgi:hypothetical protein